MDGKCHPVVRADRLQTYFSHLLFTLGIKFYRALFRQQGHGPLHSAMQLVGKSMQLVGKFVVALRCDGAYDLNQLGGARAVGSSSSKAGSTHDRSDHGGTAGYCSLVP